MNMPLNGILASLGAVTALITGIKLLSFVWLYVRPSSLKRYTRTSDGSAPWAFITGASSGIGAAFAHELASRGFNVIIHARSEAKLAAVKRAVTARFPARQVRILVADASDPSKLDFAEIAASISDVTLKVLVNNVGATMPYGHEFDTLENYSPQELLANVGANATFPMCLTSALMPNLIKTQPSLVLNVGSFTDVGLPLFPAYAPSKAFVATSCVELSLEMAMKKRDIEVLGLRVVQVTETGTILVPSSALVPTAPVWVRAALARVGCGRSNVAPYLPHALQLVAFDLMPEWLCRKVKIGASASLLQGDPMGRIAAEAAAKRAKKSE